MSNLGPLVSSRGGSLTVVLLLTLAALALRAPGIGFALPEGIEDDGGVLVRQVELLRQGGDRAEHDENWVLYPHLLACVAVLLPGEGPELPPGASLEQHLERAAAPHRAARWAVALLSLLAIPGTWWLARR